MQTICIACGDLVSGIACRDVTYECSPIVCANQICRCVYKRNVMFPLITKRIHVFPVTRSCCQYISKFLSINSAISVATYWLHTIRSRHFYM